MHRATPVNTSFRSYVAGGARCLIDKADDKKLMQECKSQFMVSEEREKIESPQNYGFTSLVVEAEKKDGMIEKSAEGFVQFMGGNRSFPVIEVMDDRRYRLRNFKEGEAAVYDDQQQKVHLQRERIYTRSQYKVEMRVIKDQPKMEGHGKDKEADRDQQKDKSRRWSTYVMDKDTITIERTDIVNDDDDKDKKTQDEPEQHIVMLSRVFLDKDHVHVLTPTISILWDEEQKKLVLNTGRNTIVLEDIETKAIISTTKFTYIKMEDGKDEDIKAVTIGAPLKVTLETPQNAVVVNDTTKKVQVGDKTASIPAAMLGSVDSNGDIIVGKVAKKVLVI
jgi:phage gp45-like